LKENPEIAMQLQAKIYDEAGLTPSDEADEENVDIAIEHDIEADGDSLSESVES
jgi:hypothetical protein